MNGCIQILHVGVSIVLSISGATHKHVACDWGPDAHLKFPTSSLWIHLSSHFLAPSASQPILIPKEQNRDDL